jgi:molybdenum cofactor biosynthesis enzyme MoaA
MHWLTYLWLNYFWPSDLGNGPEAIQQSVLYAAIAVVFIPPIRKYFSRHIKSLHDKLDGHHKAQLAQAQKHHEAILQQNEEHHEEAMKQAQTHHEAHMAALKPKRPAKKAT